MPSPGCGGGPPHALTWMRERARYTLDFHSVFILRYCEDLECTNCLL